MNKRQCKLLGQLTEVKRLSWNQWVDSKYAEKEKQKLDLVDKIIYYIKEGSRKLLKIKIPLSHYEEAGLFLIGNYQKPFDELHQAITKILLSR